MVATGMSGYAYGASTGDILHPSSATKNQPAMLTADEVGYDQVSSVATAIGHVEVVQGDSILLADRVSYDQKTDTVHATGHVSILQPTGDVFFADDAMLKNKMEKGIVSQFRARLKDNSLFAAREARKISKNVTKLQNAVYSPCHVCEPKPGEPAKAPLWQVEARKATVDEDEKRVTYQDAYMDVYGFPIIYTPYFSHPTPDAPNQSGLLTPQYFHASDLGSVVKEPVYINFAPNLDMTLTPWVMTGEKPLLEGEFRALTESGRFTAKGAITDTYNRDDSGNVIPGSEVRGFIDAKGNMKLSDHWDAGVDAERTTDQTFLQLYRFSWQNMLTSKLYAERIEDRSYIDVQTLAFQGLELQDVRSESPYILPQASLHFESDPLVAHSRLSLDSSALVLERQQGDSDQRVSSTVAWKLPYITPGGQVFTLAASARGDAYNVDDQTLTSSGALYSGQTSRFIPELDANWRYPFVSRFGKTGSIMIAPVAEASIRPDLNVSAKIPNEDSRVAELSDINLFSPNRFTGLDQVESGLRGVYGTRGQIELNGDESVEWLLGQAYQRNDESPFPITSASTANYSDYIGRIGAKYRWIDASYSFRIDRETLAFTSNEINTMVKVKPLSLDLTYAALRNDPLFGDRREIFGNASVDVTPYWKWNVSGREDLGSSTTVASNPFLPVSATNPLEATSGSVGLNTAIIYHNECMMLTTGVGRSYINELDVKPSTTFTVLLTLKNFGTPNAGSNANNVTGAGNITTGGTDNTIRSTNMTAGGAN